MSISLFFGRDFSSIFFGMDFSPIFGRDVSSKKPMECLFMVENVSSGIFLVEISLQTFFGGQFFSNNLWWRCFLKFVLYIEIFW